MTFKEFYMIESFTSNWISKQSIEFLQNYLKTRKGIRQNTKIAIENELRNRVFIDRKEVKNILDGKLKSILDNIQNEKIDLAFLEYKEMAKYFQPIIKKLDEISLFRKDEQIKFKNLKHIIKRLNYYFDELRLKSLENDDKRMFMIVMIQYLESEKQTILNMLKRLDEYSNIQKEFNHRGLTIQNSYGFRREEYSKALELLDKTIESLKGAGFSNLIYGKVVLTGSRKDHLGAAGFYLSKSDLIYLDIDAKKRYNDIYTLIHEFGHRYWYKIMTEEKRDKFTNFHSQYDKNKIITDYASTNEREHWAELFTHYIMYKINLTKEKFYHNQDVVEIVEKYK